jgi:hypothetical protein
MSEKIDLTKMTPEEAEAELKKQGYPVNSWVKSEKEGEEVHTLPFFKDIATKLEGIKSMVSNQIENDINEVNDLQIQLNRLKHGGGK